MTDDSRQKTRRYAFRPSVLLHHSITCTTVFHLHFNRDPQIRIYWVSVNIYSLYIYIYGLDTRHRWFGKLIGNLGKSISLMLVGFDIKSHEENGFCSTIAKGYVKLSNTINYPLFRINTPIVSFILPIEQVIVSIWFYLFIYLYFFLPEIHRNEMINPLLLSRQNFSCKISFEKIVSNYRGIVDLSIPNDK